MSAICSCKDPIVETKVDHKTGVQSAPFCGRCRHWYDQRHGSRPRTVEGSMIIPRGRPGSGKVARPILTRRIIEGY